MKTGIEIHSIEHIPLNYELINGTKIKFEDLFVKDIDIYTVLRKMMYKAVEESQYFDDYANGTGYEEGEYEPKIFITENEINKKIKEIINDENKKFYFSPSKIFFDFDFYFYFGEFITSENIQDIHDQVVIYDKFKTKESIFERNDIGPKNIWTCHETIAIEDRKEEYGFAEPNLYYEIYRNSWNVDVEKEFLSKKGDELIDKKMEEYKKIAKDNPNNFYILHLKSSMETTKYNNEIDLIATTVNDSVFCVDIKNKDKAIDKMLEAYRYHNWPFYETPIFLAFLCGAYESKYEKIEFERISGVESKVFIKQNMKEIFGLEDLFDDGVDYMNLIKEKTKIMLRQNWEYRNFTDAQLEDVLKMASYRIDASGIKIQIPRESDQYNEYIYEYLIEFSEFAENDLRFNDIKNI